MPVVNSRPEVKRDERGRILPGNRLGIDNRGGTDRGALRKALVDADTPENIRKIGAKLIQLALDGDVSAARLYLDHTIGKPLQSVEISGPGGNPLNLIRIVTTIMSALGNDPEAQAKVGQAVRKLELGTEETPIDVTPKEGGKP